MGSEIFSRNLEDANTNISITIDLKSKTQEENAMDYNSIREDAVNKMLDIISEAQIRWHDGERGLFSSCDFINNLGMDFCVEILTKLCKELPKPVCFHVISHNYKYSSNVLTKFTKNYIHKFTRILNENVIKQLKGIEYEKIDME